MIAVNDNLTIAEFKAYAAPKPSIAMVIEHGPEITRYYLMGSRTEGWGLVRFGTYQFERHIPGRFMAFPVAAAPRVERRVMALEAVSMAKAPRRAVGPFC